MMTTEHGTGCALSVQSAESGRPMEKPSTVQNVARKWREVMRNEIRLDMDIIRD